MIDPAIIQPFTQSGIGNMGDVTDPDSIARFWLAAADRFVIATVRALFTGGTGAGADMVLRIDHRHGVNYDFSPVTFPDSGSDDTAIWEYRVPADELYHLIFVTDPATRQQDKAVFEWTNPDPGNMRWSLEVGLINVADLRRGTLNAARLS